MNIESKQTYNDKICPLCEHKDDCDKNQFSVLNLQDKTIMRCWNYLYINRFQNNS